MVVVGFALALTIWTSSVLRINVNPTRTSENDLYLVLFISSSGGV
jgi:hypothetical protein